MKKISTVLLSCLMALSIGAQNNNASTLTVQLSGNRNKEVLVDGRSYTVNLNTDVNSNTTTTADNAPIIIEDLQAGQHTLQVVRNNNYNNAGAKTSITFSLRTGYDLLLTVNSNGTVQQTETKKKKNWNTGNTYKTPMSTANFNVLLKSVQTEWRPNSRVTLVTNAFANTVNYFTTAQAVQLLQLISSQSSRLQLAKSSYRSITDPVNFTQVNNLLSTAASRNDLSAYVATYNANNTSGNTSYHTPMSDASFTALYKSVNNQWKPGAKVTAITNAFTNTNNYYTTYQARQLIQLVPEEYNRLTLAKQSYRGITDPASFSQLYDLFTSQASRNELASYVNNGNVNNGYNTAMTDANFTVLYQDIQRQWQAGAKLTALTNTFNNTNNYFSTNQAKQLILLVPEEYNRLNLAKLAYRRLADPVNYAQLNDVLTSQASRNDLAAYVNTYSSGYPVYPTTPARIPMTDAAFNSLNRDVQNRFGLGAKFSALTDIFNTTTNYFTTYQAKQLIQLVSLESNRLDLAKAGYDNLTDPSNFTQLNDLLSTQASRNELALYVSTYNTNNPGYNDGAYNYKTPMTDAGFTTIYNNVQNQFGLGAKMTSLTDVFANTLNYFTTAQAKQLIGLVTTESNRLQLAKSSYDNITDPANFTQLYDLLSTQASRNELAAYVSSYSYR